MKQYITFFRMSMMKGLQYRVAAFAGVCTQFFFGLLFIMIFEAFYNYSNSVQAISFKELTQMIWLQQAFLLFIAMWIRDSELNDMIVSGNISYELCRPTKLYNYWFARLLGQRLSGTILRFLPILIIAFFLPESYRLTLPSDLLTLILFIITLVLGLILVLTLSMLMYISVFYTLSAAGSFLIFNIFGEFFAGLIIPIPLMPTWLRNLAYCLPFRYTADLPFRVYAGNIKTEEAVISIIIQIFWITFLLLIGKKTMSNALKKVVIQGG